MKNLILLLLTAALGLGLWSCSTETGPDGIDQGSVESLSFKISVPKDAYVTRGIAGTNEWNIATMNVYASDVASDYGVSQMVAGTDYMISPALGGTAKNYTIIFTDSWLRANKGKNIRFYFVGNNDSSGGPHTSLTNSNSLRDALTNTLEESTPGKLDLILKPDGTNNLLFSAETDPVTITGTLQQNAQLKRRAARFDIKNDYKSDFEVTKVVVGKAASTGFIFPNGDPSRVSINYKNHQDIPGLSASDYIEDAPGSALGAKNLVPSAFYLYPTLLGTNNTTITVYGKSGGGSEEAYPVLIDGTIEAKANFRYIIEMTPTTNTAVLNFIGEIDEGETISTPISGGSGDDDPDIIEILDMSGFNTPYSVHQNSELLKNDTDLWEEDEKTAYIVSDRADATFSALVGTGAGGSTYRVEYAEGDLQHSARSGSSVPSTKVNVTKTTQSSTRAYASTDRYTFTVSKDSGAFRAKVTFTSVDDGSVQSFWINKLFGGFEQILLIKDGKLSFDSWIPDFLSRKNIVPAFQFGSVIAVGLDASYQYYSGSSTPKIFNPTSIKPYQWSEFPRFTSEDYDAGIRNISSPEYTNPANIRLGKGDPCMLSGYTSDQITGMSNEQLQTVLDEAIYRTPTWRENSYFIGDGTAWDNFYNSAITQTPWQWQNPVMGSAFNPRVGTGRDVALIENYNGYEGSYVFFLSPPSTSPVLGIGYLNSSGVLAMDPGNYGLYWSSTPVDNTTASYWAFGAYDFYMNNSNPYSTGQMVRCVPR